jgi:hypothetical protein
VTSTIARRGAATSTQRRAGDISDAFTSLSGQSFTPLPQKYADQKGRLIAGREDEIRASWDRLLERLKEEIPILAQAGSSVIPEIDFKHITRPSEQFKADLKKRGVAVVRGVVPEEQALAWKEGIREYVRANPHTKGKEACSVFKILITVQCRREL